MDRQDQKTGERESERSRPEPAAIPLRFRHHDLIQNPDMNKTIEQFELINLWNSIHFMEGTVYVQLHLTRYKDDLLIEAHPLPCSGNSMTCLWPEDSQRFTENVVIVNIILTDGLSVYLIPARSQNIQKDRFTIETPEQGYILGQRQARHYRCRDVNVEVLQNGFHARGRLTDFSALAFSIRANEEETDSFRYFDPECPLTVNLYRNGQMVFSSPCRCIRQTSEQKAREMVLAPTTGPISGFLKKKFRNPRVRVAPLPNITFDHPLTGKKIKLDIQNLSSSGFAVYLTADEDVLMTRMIIPDLTLNVAGALKIRCKAQVLNRRVEKNYIRYGFVILDMDISTYNRLSHIVMNTIDPGIHIADTVDTDQLWELFFESGFIYPGKYDLLQSYRKSMKEMYRRLYRDNPPIITQVTYQQNGRVYGHVSMVRAYERTWMFQHLAARAFKNERTGLQILKQIIRYFDGLYCFPTVGMDYLMFYFRPENRFPNRFFGDFARHLNNPQACSLDLFSYLSYPIPDSAEPVPAGWSLEPCTDDDLEELNRFYRNASGGLLLDVLRPGGKEAEGKSLSDLYASYGFTRSYRSFSLRQNESVMAILVVNQSDTGLSLSDFLNGIKILAIESAGLSWSILSAAISQLAMAYRIEQIPLLVYPSDYFKTQRISCKKQYNLWIIDVDHGREYVEYRYGKHKTQA